MKQINRTVIARLFVLIGLVFAAVFVYMEASSVLGAEIYDEAAQLAFSGEAVQPVVTPAPDAGEWVPAPVTDDPHYEEMRTVDLAALREVNPDVVGWIMIPGTEVNYPMVQAEDNDRYLRRAWTGKRNYVGSIFLEHKNTPDFTDYNTIVYGHNMNNGDMFGQLRSYNSGSFRKKNPYIYIASDSGVYRYEVFSVYRADTDSHTYRLNFVAGEEKADFLIHALKADDGNYGIFPEPTDRILTLSTCTTGGKERRYVVQARLPMVQTLADS